MSGTATVLQQFVSGLKSRNEDTRAKSAKDLQHYVTTELREVTQPGRWRCRPIYIFCIASFELSAVYTGSGVATKTHSSLPVQYILYGGRSGSHLIGYLFCCYICFLFFDSDILICFI